MTRESKRTLSGVEITSGAVLPAFLAMAAPQAASRILQLLFNAADMVVLGNCASEYSLAAVGSTIPLVNLVLNFFFGLSVGVNILVAYYLGARDESLCARATHASLVLAALAGVIVVALGVPLAPTLLRICSVPEETLGLSTTYLRVYFFGAFAALIYNFGAAIMRAYGDTKRPMYYLLVAGVLNVILNFILVAVLHWDVLGVALATVTSQYLSAILIFRRLMRQPCATRVEWRKFRMDWRILGALLRRGVPAGLQASLFSIANVAVQIGINGFGPIVMAGSAAAENIEDFIWVTMYSFAECSLTFTSQALGARKYSRLNRIAATSICCAMAVGLTLGLVVNLYGSFLLSLYDSRAEVISAGMTRLFWVSGFYALCGFMDSLANIVRGLGYNVTPAVTSLVGACVLRVAWIATGFQLPEFHTFSALLMIYPITWVVTGAAHGVVYIIARRGYPKVDELEERTC
ncbi:MAG: MATE family efflux transporter [Planctomycetia bacterium]|nr:MATE family efflux transporter [Planctomycetia bacterium]